MSEPATPFKVKSIFEYKSEFEDDLTFPIGKIITVTEVEDEEWFSGELEGKSGMFPKNFVEILPVEPSVPVPTSRPTPKKVAPVVTQSPSIAKEETEHAKPLSSTSPTVEARKSSIGGGTGVKVPLPYQSNQRVNDPYSIKKQFVATGHSSYVPQIKPRDDSNIISHALHDVSTDDKDIVKATPVSEKQIEHEEEPKVSLKDRIALLQKQQQEEAELQAAALVKKEERKKRHDDGKEKSRQRKEAHDAATELASQKSGDNESLNLSRRNSIESHRSIKRHDSHREDAIEEGVGEYGEEYGVEENNLHRPRKIKEADEEVEDDDNDEEEEEEEEDDGDDDEADEESEDEESKRRKLVERMAKISGGRNMFGMMGMASPFGAAPAPAVEKTTKTKKKSSKSGESATESAELPKSIPIIPTSVKHEDSQHPKLRESSSMVEEDSDSDDRYVEVEAPRVNLDAPSLNNPSGPISKQIVEASDSGIEDIKKPSEEIKITKTPIEPEATGYEADEDLSDLKTNTLDSDIEIPPPPPPTKNTSTPLKDEVVLEHDSTRSLPPPPPSAPHIPSLPSSVPPVPQVPSAPPAISSRPPPPPPPTGAPPTSHLPPPPPPPPVPTRGLHDEEEEDDDEEGQEEEEEEEEDDDTPVLTHREINNGDDDEFAFTPNVPTRANTAPTQFYDPAAITGVPPIPTSIPPVPSSFIPPIPSNYPPPPDNIRRASTEVFHHQQAPISNNTTGASIGSRQSLDSSVSRSRSGKGTKTSDQSQAEVIYDELHDDISNNITNQQWWLTDELPDKLTTKIGNDLIFEVDKNSVAKRGSRDIVIKDYYILFYDLSQIVIELQFDTRDPRSTVKLVNFFIKPIPIIRKDLLDKYHRNFSSLIVNAGSQMMGTKLSDNIVKIVLDSPQTTAHGNQLLHTIGSKSFGVTIYKNINNTNVEKIDEIKSGDILWIKNGKFQSHKGLVGSKSITTGDEYTAIIYEYDNSNKKEKLRVIETDASGNVKRETYKLSEFKSGRIRIFRPVGKDYVGW